MMRLDVPSAEAGAPSGFEALAVADPAVLDAIPAGVYVCRADGVIVRFNRRAVELWGREPQLGDSEERFCGACRLYHPDGRPLPHAETPMATALRTGAPAQDVEVIIERPDGSRVIALVNIRALKDQRGRIQGAINCFQDITARKALERMLREAEHRSRELLEALPAAICTTDAEGWVTYYNEAAASLWGCRPALAAVRWCGFERLYYPDGTPMPHEECPMAVALKENRPIAGAEGVAERLDGARIPFLAYPTPLRDPGSGAALGAVNMLVDITERKRAEEELRRSRQDLEDFFEEAVVALHWVGKDGTILRANRAELGLLGYSADEYVGRHIAEFHADGAAIEDILARLKRGERLDKYEARLRAKDGSIRHVMISSNALFRDGQFVHTRCFTIDITDLKRAEEHQRLLLGELNHRVKNTLSVVQSVAAQTRRSARSPTDFAEAFEGRLLALSRAHDLLTRGAWQGASLAEVVRLTLAPHLLSERAEGRVVISGPELRLAPGAAVSLNLVFHELATNAAKYGALSVPTGRVTVAWRLEQPAPADGRQLEIIDILWRERGGPLVEPPRRRGFGSRLIEQGAAHDLGGEVFLDFAPAGVEYRLRLPLSAKVRIA